MPPDGGRKGAEMKQGIIFDVDGTLWDAAVQVADSWNEVLAEHPEAGVTITVQDMNNNMGKTMDELARAFFLALGQEEQMKLMEQCMAYENRYLKTHPGVLYPGVKETIRRLADEYQLFVVSNCQSGYIEALLESHGLGEYIRDIECFGNTGLPKGDNIRMVAERNHLDQCFYVGDTVMDQTASAKAGVPFVHAAYGYGEVTGAAARLESMEQLPDIAKQLFDQENTGV